MRTGREHSVQQPRGYKIRSVWKVKIGDTITDNLGRNEGEASPVFSNAEGTLAEDAHSLTFSSSGALL